MENRIFLLATRERGNKTYCLGVHHLGTENMEFIVGETDNDKEYRQGDEVTYIYQAEYFIDIEYALSFLEKVSKRR